MLLHCFYLDTNGLVYGPPFTRRWSPTRSGYPSIPDFTKTGICVLSWPDIVEFFPNLTNTTYCVGVVRLCSCHKAVKILRNVIKQDKILGISTHNEAEVLQANEMDLNYIGLGAFRDTGTKKDISTVIGNKLDDIALKSKHLVGAIGGVKRDDKFTHVAYHVIGSGLIK